MQFKVCVSFHRKSHSLSAPVLIAVAVRDSAAAEVENQCSTQASSDVVGTSRHLAAF